MDSNDSTRKKQIWAALAVLIAIALIVGGGAVASKVGEEANEPISAQLSDDDTRNTASTATANIDSAAKYKDGTYTASSGFDTPGGSDKMDLTVTIKNGVISSSSAITTPPDSESENFDQNFLGAYKDLVVGKSLGQVKVNRVAGASLTTQGFNHALQQIADQAKA